MIWREKKGWLTSTVIRTVKLASSLPWECHKCLVDFAQFRAPYCSETRLESGMAMLVISEQRPMLLRLLSQCPAKCTAEY